MTSPQVLHDLPPLPQLKADTLNLYHLRKAVAYLDTWVRPELTDRRGAIGPYANDMGAVLVDHAQERSSEPIVHSHLFDANVGANFIDPARFGPLNILLEILQNAEGNDSGGTRFSFELWINGEWVDYRVWDGQNLDQLKAMRIGDNGRGYLPTDMIVLGSAKKGDPNSAGNFGSGGKLADKLALDGGMRVVRYTRNCRAMPFLRPTVTTGMDVQTTVSYAVDFFERFLSGSVVEYHDLPPAILEVLPLVGNDYLPLDSTFDARLLCETAPGLILKPAEAKASLYVKGRSYQLVEPFKYPLLYSYDLRECAIDDQNRHHVDKSRAEKNIQAIWEKVEDVELWKTLIKAATNGTILQEHQMEGFEPPEAFKQALLEIYGVSSLGFLYLADSSAKASKGFKRFERDEEVEERLKAWGHVGVDCQNRPFLKKALKKLGIHEGSSKDYDLRRNLVNTQTVSLGRMAPVSFVLDEILSIMGRLFPTEKKIIEVHLDDDTVLSYKDFLALPRDDGRKPKALFLNAVTSLLLNKDVTAWPAEMRRLGTALGALYYEFHTTLRSGNMDAHEFSVGSCNDRDGRPFEGMGAYAIEWPYARKEGFSVGLFPKTEKTSDRLKEHLLRKVSFAKRSSRAKLFVYKKAEDLVFGIDEVANSVANSRLATGLTTVVGVTGLVACVGFTLYEVSSKIADANRATSAYQSEYRADSTYHRGINVSTEPDISGIGDYPEWYLDKRGEEYASSPALGYGNYFSEHAYTTFDGHRWSGEVEQDFPTVGSDEDDTIISHLKRVGISESSKAVLKRLAGSSIELETIRVTDKEGQVLEQNSYQVKLLPNGEVEVTFNGDKPANIFYQTVLNHLDESKGREVRNENYQALDPATRQTYLQVPYMERDKIPFDTSVVQVRGEKNLNNYLKALVDLPPYERVMVNYQTVKAMRYVTAGDSARDGAAYANFKSGNSPYKDLLTFLLSSPDLEKVGDGDCDVHNTAFILLNRLAGVPSRMSDVITAGGGAHVVSEVYFPNEGWVQFDATGSKLEPKHKASASTSSSSAPLIVESPSSAAERLLARQKYNDLQCDELAQEME